MIGHNSGETPESLSTQELPEFLDTKGVAKHFPFTESWLTKDRIYSKAEDRLPFIRIGDKVVYRTSSIRAWLAARETGRAA